MHQSNWLGLVALLTGFASGCGTTSGEHPDAASGASSVGHACTSNDGCGSGLTCDMTVLHGYCTKSCTMQGATSECPEGAICGGLEGKGYTTCLKICATKADCDPLATDPLECSGVSNSSILACHAQHPG